MLAAPYLVLLALFAKALCRNTSRVEINHGWVTLPIVRPHYSTSRQYRGRRGVNAAISRRTLFERRVDQTQKSKGAGAAGEAEKDLFERAGRRSPLSSSRKVLPATVTRNSQLHRPLATNYSDLATKRWLSRAVAPSPTCSL